MHTYAILVLLLVIIGCLIYFLAAINDDEDLSAIPLPNVYQSLEPKQKRILLISAITVFTVLFLIIAWFKIKNLKTWPAFVHQLIYDNGYEWVKSKGSCASNANVRKFSTSDGFSLVRMGVCKPLDYNRKKFV